MLKSTIKSLLTHALAPIRLPIRRVLHDTLKSDAKDISTELQRRALTETAEYVEQKMSQIDSVTSKLELLTLALRHVTINPGLYLEFGVFSGRTINHVAASVSQPVYGFDSFEGLPERWRDSFTAGRFKVDALPAVRANVQLIKGWFDQTLPGFVASHSGEVALLHVDCDLYSSTKTIFSELKTRIKPGTVIVFDEYFNYPGWKEGEYKSFQEFIAETGLRYEYLGYNRLHEQVAVKIL